MRCEKPLVVHVVHWQVRWEREVGEGGLLPVTHVHIPVVVPHSHPRHCFKGISRDDVRGEGEGEGDGMGRRHGMRPHVPRVSGLRRDIPCTSTMVKLITAC